MSHLRLAGWLSEWIFMWLSGFLPASLSLLLCLSLFLVPSPDWAGVVEGRQFCLLCSFYLEPNWCSFAVPKFPRKLESCAIHYSGHWPHVAIQINENCIKWKIPSSFTLMTFQVLIYHMWLVAAMVNTQVETMSTCWTTVLENETDLTSPSPSLAVGGNLISRGKPGGWGGLMGPWPWSLLSVALLLHKEEAWWPSLGRPPLPVPTGWGTGELLLPPASFTPTTWGPSWLGPVHCPPPPRRVLLPLAMLGVSTSYSHLTLLSVT